jgi:hypothetical protein
VSSGKPPSPEVFDADKQIFINSKFAQVSQETERFLRKNHSSALIFTQGFKIL